MRALARLRESDLHAAAGVAAVPFWSRFIALTHCPRTCLFDWPLQ